MGKITELSQGSLNGLRRQLNECIENAYNKGYTDGKKEPNEEHEEYIRNLVNKAKQEGYDTGYNNALEEFCKLYGYENDYKEFFLNVYAKPPFHENITLFDAVARYGIATVMADFKKWQEQKKQNEEIKVGDIVIWENATDFPFIITLSNCQTYVAMTKEGSFTHFKPNSKLKKIGNVSDKLQTLLDKLKGDKE